MSLMPSTVVTSCVKIPTLGEAAFEAGRGKLRVPSSGQRQQLAREPESNVGCRPRSQDDLRGPEGLGRPGEAGVTLDSYLYTV
jgi:hypothetical protein